MKKEISVTDVAGINIDMITNGVDGVETGKKEFKSVQIFSNSWLDNGIHKKRKKRWYGELSSHPNKPLLRNDHVDLVVFSCYFLIVLVLIRR